MTSPRPTSMTVASILNFVFGGIGIVFALTSVVMMSNPLNAMAANVPIPPGMAGWTVASGFLSVAVGSIAIISGIGLIQAKPWGRSCTFAYAIAAIVNSVVGLLLALLTVTLMAQSQVGTDKTIAIVVGLVLGAATALVRSIYPMILLFLLRSAKWKEAFATVTS